MGWDAFAYKADGECAMIWDSKESQFKNLPDYHEAAVIVARECGTWDGLLSYGGLDVSTCGRMLETATGESVYKEDWSAEAVKQLAENANWNFTVDEDETWAKASARAFLEVAAKLGHSIHFSW